MKEGWTYKKLGEVCDFQGGSQPPKNEWSKEPKEGYVRMLQIRDFTQNATDYIEYVKVSPSLKFCNEDDILIGRYGASVGKILSGLSGAYNVAIIKTIPKDKVIKNYIKFFFLSPYFQHNLLKTSQNRAAQAGFSKEDITDFRFPCPPISEQERIVSELDLLSGIIEKKKAQLKEYDQLAQSIFYDMFGDPVTNEKGWEMKRLEDACLRITDGAHFSPKEDEKGKYPMLSVKDMGANSFIYEHCKLINEKDYLFLVANGCKPSINDVLVAKDGSYLKTSFVQKEDKEQVILSSIAILTPLMKKVSPEYLAFLFKLPQTKSIVERNYLTGTALKRVILKGFKMIRIPLPPLPLQHSFAEKIEAIEKQKELIKQSIAETETLFNSRMDYYFN